MADTTTTTTGTAPAQNPQSTVSNVTAEQRLAILRAEAKKIQNELGRATDRNTKITDEVNRFAQMLDQVKNFEISYGKAQEQALKKKLEQPYTERVAEAEGAINRKHHGALKKIVEIVDGIPDKEKSLQTKITKAETVVSSKQKDYDEKTKTAGALQKQFQDLLSTNTTFDSLASQGLAIGDKVSQFEQANNYAGMYVYAKEWEKLLRGQRAPAPKEIAQELNDKLVELDLANDEVRTKQKQLDDATADLNALKAELNDLQTNRLTIILNEIYAQVPGMKPAST